MMLTKHNLLTPRLALALCLFALHAAPPLIETVSAQRPGAKRASTPSKFVKQNEVVRFPRAGEVRVRAIEIPHRLPRLEFTSAATGRRLLTVSGGASDPRAYRIEPGPTLMNPLVRFKVLHPSGLPGPLLLCVAVRPGGSDHGFETNVIGEVGGSLRVLTPTPLLNSIQGGVHVGDLGGERGPGVAVWSFLWENEAHYAAHRYEVRLFPFDAKRNSFKRGKLLRTKAKHETGADALAELGLPRYPNLLDEMPELEDYRN